MSVVCIVCYQVEVSAKADRSSRGVLSTVVRRCVWFRKLVNVKVLVHWGLLQQKKKIHILILTARVLECPGSAALLAVRANCDTVTYQSEGSTGRTRGTFPRVSSDHPRWWCYVLRCCTHTGLSGGHPAENTDHYDNVANCSETQNTVIKKSHCKVCWGGHSVEKKKKLNTAVKSSHCTDTQNSVIKSSHCRETRNTVTSWLCCRKSHNTAIV